MAALAMQVAAEVGAGALLGWLFDRWRGTSSGVLIGAVIGILVGLWSLIKGGLKLNRQLDREAPLKGRGKPLIEESTNLPTEGDDGPSDEEIDAYLARELKDDPEMDLPPFDDDDDQAKSPRS